MKNNMPYYKYEIICSGYICNIAPKKLTKANKFLFYIRKINVTNVTSIKRVFRHIKKGGLQIGQNGQYKNK
jgi:hypothetical protein